MEITNRRRGGRHPLRDNILTDPGPALANALHAVPGDDAAHDERWTAAKNLISRVDTIHGRRMLDLGLLQCDGGEYGSSYEAANIVARNRSVYCSCKSSNVTAILQHRTPAPAPSFVVTHAVLVAPPSGHFTAPVKEAILFVSSDPLTVAELARFDGYTRRGYDELLRRTDAAGLSRLETDPAAYLTVDDRTRVAVAALAVPRTGRFVGVKFLRARDDQHGSNIDVEFVGVKGFTGPKGFAEGTLR